MFHVKKTPMSKYITRKLLQSSIIPHQNYCNILQENDLEVVVLYKTMTPDLFCFMRFVSFVGCLASQQQASVSQGRICSDNFTCCHTEVEAADPTYYLTQSQSTDTGPTSPSADPIMTGAWQDNHRSANFEASGMTRPGIIPSQAGFELGISRSRGVRLNH